MRLATIHREGKETTGIVLSQGIYCIETLNAYTGASWKTDMMSLIQAGEIPGLTYWYTHGGKEKLETLPGVVPYEKVQYAPLYRNPQRIFGIGLNYVDHAGDLGEQAPVGFPGSFYKPASTIIGDGDEIHIPRLAEAKKTTAEAELGIILGKDCKYIDEADWQDYVAGYTTILDMTEESILRQNPRFLTLVKGFDTFFSFGPQFVTPDEIDDVLQLKVQSVHNGVVHAENIVNHMTHKPSRLISLISHMQGWKAGDILSTGTPRAFPIAEGDIAECRIMGPNQFQMKPLRNPVIDLKLHPERI